MNINKNPHTQLKKKKRLDLNLLVYFHAVYQTGSVKHAASFLNCSSPNVSQSLQKLREIIGDPLFIRDGQQLSATTVAARLYDETKDNIHELLYSIENLSEKIQRKLVIECMPYFSIKITPLITLFLQSKNIDCEIVQMSHTTVESVFWERLSLKKVDLVFGMKVDLEGSKMGYRLGSDTCVLVCRKNHPRIVDSYIYGSDVTESITKIHSDISELHKMRSLNNDYFQNSPCSLQAKSLLAICSHISVSDSIAIIPSSFYEKFKEVFNLKSLKTNLQMPDFDEYMYFNKASSDKELYLELYRYVQDNYDKV